MLYYTSFHSESCKELVLVESHYLFFLRLSHFFFGKPCSASYNNVPTLIPMEEISCLEPRQSAKRVIQVRFHHHLLPMRLTLHYNGKEVPVKLRPDLGYLVKPFSMSIEEFLATESRLPGMFEYSRRLAAFST